VSVACVVPGLDAAVTLPDVIAGVRASVPNVTIIVVDDGSSDDTAAVARPLADQFIRHEQTIGKGAALRAGISAALARGALLVATIDGDGQHPPAALPSLIAAAKDADVVLGCRRRSGTAMPLQRRLSNWISSRVVSRLAGQRIEDSQCGLRVMRSEVLRKVVALGDRYEFETELLVRAARAGFRVASVEIPTLYTGEHSHFRSLRDTSRVIVAMLRLAMPRAR
jgi:glycosyltransferase involved in cell wall biosynthesis